MKKNTPKRRLASTRNMSKQDKRRVQLHKTTKNKTEQKTRSGRVMFSRPDDSTLFVRGNRSEAAAKTPLNKRLIALVLAVIMILALIPAGIFMLRPKAATTPMGETPMTVRINGVDKGTATIDPGDIETNIEAGNIDYGSVSIPSDAEFVKAVIVSDNNIETEIYSVSSQGDTNYYSISKDAYTGVAKDDDETLVLIFANKYYVNFGTATLNASGYWETSDGTFTATVTPEVNTDTNVTKYFVYGGEDLEIKEITAKTDRTVSAVDYTTGSNSGTEQIKNSMVTIPSNMYAGDISVNVKFNENKTYTVQDARYMSNSVYYAKYKGLDNHGGTAQSLEEPITTNSLDSVAASDTATFYVFSQKNTTNQHAWELSMLSINGVDLKFPYNTGEANAVETPFKDGRKIKVVYESNSYKFPTSSSSSKTDGPRTVYRIEVPDVHENLEVNYYVTDTLERTLIVKGLNGINKTAASIENKVLTGNLVGKWYTYTTSSLNVYEAFYDSRTNYPADNLVLYTVKPGYNPYAITTTMYVDGDDATDSIRATEKTGTPVQVIKQASNSTGGNFNTAWRYWGVNNGELINTDKRKWGDELLLTTLSKDNANTWYAVALGQSSKKNQQLVLNAPEYKYAIEVDLDEGDLTASGYTTSDSIMNETSTHTVADTTPYMFLPTGTPIKQGYVFTGYRLVDIDGDTYASTYADDNKYMPSDRIDIDSTAFDYAYGNRKDSTNNTVLKLRFQATWKATKDATTVTVNTAYQTGVDSNGDAVYSTETSVTEASAVGDAAVIDDHVVVDGTALSKSKYYTLSDDSNITLKATSTGSNEFTVKYDYKLQNLTVKKTVLGYPKTKKYEITVTLTPGADSPVSIDSALALLNQDGTYAEANEENTAITYVRTIQDGDSWVLSVPYKWDYAVTEPTVADDYTNDIDPSSGTMTKDAIIDVTNMVDNSVVGGNKTLSGPDANGEYSLTLESWATGTSFTKPKSSTQPLDIALVIDQSGSMATGDMSINYLPAEVEENVYKTQWYTSDIVNGEQYYYQVGDNYYPVYAEEGPLYSQVESNPDVYYMFGGGHDMWSYLANGAPTHYNVKTDYYAFGTDGKMHRIWFITNGNNLKYYAYPYYYVDEDDEATNYPEWETNIYWFVGFDPWERHDYDKLNEDSTWKTLTTNNRVRFLGYSTLNQTAAKGCRMTYKWRDKGDPLSATLYKKVSGTTYNRLYYLDDNGNPQYFSTTATFSTDPVYNDVLYVARGKTRLSILTKSVEDFAEVVAENAASSGADHRIAIVGFASNLMPSLSTANGIYHYSGQNDKWDYVNTGLFVPTEDGSESTFRTYDEITEFKELSSDPNTNLHYFIDDSGTKIPVRYSGTTWYRVDTGASVTRSTSNPFYYAVYDELDKNDHYGKALVSASKKEDGEFTGEVADSITSAISQFGDYGGTYTSYGMTMAGQVFANNSATDSNGVTRKRVVIVFTDGEPGAYGYDKAIAGEAKVDSGNLKESGVEVYTIGLFPGSTSTDVEDFMHHLSSEYQQTTTDVYGGSSNNGLGTDLDINEVYYYTDESRSDKKTYSVTTNEDTLAWWAKDGGVYWKVVPTPKTGTGQSGVKEGCVQFYKVTSSGSVGDAVYSTDDGFPASGQQYCYYDTDAKAYYYVNYEYRWYDSDNYVVAPKTSSTDDDSTHKQFYKLNNPTENSDNTYYYKATKASLLESYFNQIAESISSSTTEVSLNSQNVMMQDIITDNFDASGATVKVEKVPAEMTNDEVSAKSGGTVTDITSQVRVNFDQSSEKASTIQVTGFNYGGDNYISDTHDGYLLRTTISGLKPKTTGFDIPSNESESGVFEVLYPDDDYKQDPTGVKILAQYDIPEVDRPTYTLKVDGDDRTTDYTVTFKVYDKNGDLVTTPFSQPVLTNGTLGSISFSGGSGTWTSSNATNDDQVIVFEDLPDGYTVKAVTTKNTTLTTYDYSLEIEDEDGKTLVSPDPEFGAEAELPQSGSVIHISSTRHTVAVTLREQTLQSDGTTGGNADPDKYFDIVLTLTREDGSTLGEAVTYSGIEFDEEGVATVQMKHDQVRTLDLPEGFKLAIDVDPDSQDLYLDTYTKGTTINNGVAYGTDEYPATVIVNGQYITIFNKIDFPLPTGMFDNKVPVSVILLAVAGVLGLAVAGAYVYRRKRRLNDR